MAGGGVGEAMLIGAAVGAGTGAVSSAVQKKDVLQGALLGGAMGAAGGGIGSWAGGAAAGEMGGAAGGAATPGEVAAGQQLFGTGVESGVGATTGTTGATTGGAGINFPTNFAETVQSANALQLPSASTGASTAAPTGTSWGSQGLGQGFAPGLTNAQAYGAGAGGGIMGLVGQQQAQGQNNMAPAPAPYTGPLSKFNYDPNQFRPSVAPGYAEGGITSLATGGVQQTGMFPQSQMDKTQFATPSQMPISREIIGSDYDTTIDPYTGDLPRFADGGISNLGSYSDGGRMLRGPGDGMSDDIPGVIAGKQPARLADGEFVVPADVVSHLGNGSTDAGAKKLYSMMDNVRKARTGTKKQGKKINAEKHIPGMAKGGVAHYEDGGSTSEDTPSWFSNWLATQENTPRPGAGSVSPSFQPTGFTGAGRQYTPYTMTNRPSSAEPQYYQDIYRGSYPDFSTPGYTLAGNLGQWSNVAGEAQRAAQPASLNQQVTQSYLQNLGRAPDTAGFNEWMQSGLTGPQINQLIQSSGESYQINPTPASAEGFLESRYKDILGRAADRAGLDYWSQQLQSGNMNVNQIDQAMRQSPEAQIAQAYKQYLGRTADQPGQQYWAGQVGSGAMNVEQAINAIKGSEEGKTYAAKQAPKEEKKRRGGIASLV